MKAKKSLGQNFLIDNSIIDRIVDVSGNVIYENNHDKTLVLNPSLVYILNDLMTGTYDLNLIDYNYPTCGSLSNKITHKYALKTGTTDTDSWTIGYNKDILIGIWNGYDDAREINLDTIKISKNIWVDTIESYFKNKKPQWYEMPSDVVGVLVNPIDGSIATNNSKKKKILYFIKGTEPIN
jgi:membrane carboxypeptidase/penicillin-binding protein